MYYALITKQPTSRYQIQAKEDVGLHSGNSPNYGHEDRHRTLTSKSSFG